MINLSLPLYYREDWYQQEFVRPLDPITTYGGYSIKDGAKFCVGPLIGSKVRQCLHVVHENLDLIHKHHNSGILTGAGLPSPQVPIVAGVAKYFRLKCAVTTPRYDNTKRDFNRINASLAQHFGATVYGVRNPNPSGYEKDAKELVKELGYYQIKFGMIGNLAMEPVIEQVRNIPDMVRRIVIVSSSGLSALSVMRGIARYQKPVQELYVVTLSGHFEENKRKWYDTQGERFNGYLKLIPSEIPYRTEHKYNKGFDFDLTYESKAFQWMVDHLEPSRETLFWVVGKRIYDLDVIQPIAWQMSAHERALRTPRPTLF